MRAGIIACIGLLLVALLACAAVALRSRKPIASDVRLLLLALVPPMLGNLLIIGSSDWLVAQIGCYLYYLGMDLTVLGLFRFTFNYCAMEQGRGKLRFLLFALLGADVVQLLLNPVLGHAFYTSPLMVDGRVYHAMVPLAGQTFHRALAYGVFFAAVAIFV